MTTTTSSSSQVTTSVKEVDTPTTASYSTEVCLSVLDSLELITCIKSVTPMQCMIYTKCTWGITQYATIIAASMPWKEEPEIWNREPTSTRHLSYAAKFRWFWKSLNREFCEISQTIVKSPWLRISQRIMRYSLKTWNDIKTCGNDLYVTLFHAIPILSAG